MTPPKIQVSAIVISYNTCEMTLRCLRDLRRSLEGLSGEIWVVDNASDDGSPDAIAAEFPDVRLIRNQENSGFGAANNMAMALAKGDFLFLLNSDAFTNPGTLNTLLDRAACLPKAAVLGPRLLNRDGSLQRSCWKFPSPRQAWLENLGLCALFPNNRILGDYGRWSHDSEREVDFVIGACMLVRRQLFEDLGGFDPRFFMYAEETDWQKRMTNTGWKVVFVPTTTVEHWGGASGKQNRVALNGQFYASMDKYVLKYHGLHGLVSLRIAMVVGNLLRLPIWIAMSVSMSKRAYGRTRAQRAASLIRRQLTHWRMG